MYEGPAYQNEDYLFAVDALHEQYPDDPWCEAWEESDANPEG
jgi:hypothetical protein